MAAAAVLIVGFVGFGARPAAADEFCDSRVFDESGGRIGAVRQGLEQAAGTVSNTTGADLYVRAMSRVPGGDLDAWQAAAERRCPAWGGLSGGRSPNLIVLAVSVDDRKTGIYYGSRWKAALDPSWRSIQDSAMNSRFRQGDVGGGLLQGLVQVAAAIAPVATPVTEAPPFMDRRPVPSPVPVAEPIEDDDWRDGGGGSDGADAWLILVLALGAVGAVFSIARTLTGGSGGSIPPVARAQADDEDEDSGLFGSGGLFSGGGSSSWGSGGSSSGGGGSSSWDSGSSSGSSSGAGFSSGGGSSSGGGGGGGSSSW